jgi:anaerobic ribonucleoside-triphosphate reductase
MVCHDCKKEMAKGEEYMPYAAGGKEFLKCRACHEAAPVLRNFQEAEVYSRVVGYIRPVKQWNKGKQAEFGDRKEYAPLGGGLVAEACAC